MSEFKNDIKEFELDLNQCGIFTFPKENDTKWIKSLQSSNQTSREVSGESRQFNNISQFDDVAIPMHFSGELDLSALFNKKEKKPPKYIILNKDNKKLYIPIDNILNGTKDWIKDCLRLILNDWNTSENFDNVKKILEELRNQNNNNYINEIIELFRPIPTLDEISYDKKIISDINSIINNDNDNGKIIKLLLTLITGKNLENSKKIFNKILETKENYDEKDLIQLETGTHKEAKNISIDLLVNIREIIITIFFMPIDINPKKFEILSNKNKKILSMIDNIKKIIINSHNIYPKSYIIEQCIMSTCTASRTKKLCTFLQNTDIKCNNETKFDEKDFNSTKEFIIDIINNFELFKDNKLLLKKDDKYMIGGNKYFKKYQKYKAKYLKLKNI